MEYTIYSLEYRQLVLEQMSHERESQFLKDYEVNNWIKI
jgi:hypothetical protein